MNLSFFGSEEPGGKPVVGKGRGKVLEELTGLYRTTGRAACLQKLVSPRQQDKHGYAGKAAITHVLVMLHHHAFRSLLCMYSSPHSGFGHASPSCIYLIIMQVKQPSLMFWPCFAIMHLYHYYAGKAAITHSCFGHALPSCI